MERNDVLSASVQESARDRIMNRIKTGAARHREVALPDVPMFDIQGDPVENFIAWLESFDGKAVRVKSGEEIGRAHV